MGGPSALRSLPPSEALVEARGIAIMEYRVSILRDLSLPLFLIWGSNVQLSAGLECGAGTRQTQTIGACGATAGITGTGDALGGIPQMMGLTAAWPLWAQGLDYTANLAPELYLRWWQEF
jgi:hypothetical protein